MLKMHEIRELIKLVDQSHITDFEYEFEGLKVSMKKGETVPTPLNTMVTEQEHAPYENGKETEVRGEEHSPAPPKTEDIQKENGLHTIESPMVGTFYRAPSPEADPYVQSGDHITESTVVCIVEAMKLMNEIEAEVRGEIVDVLAENGQLVEYGQPLFLVKPE